MGATGLAADPAEYRTRLGEQSDDQIDAWVAELLRDLVVRRGIVKVVHGFISGTGLDEGAFERVFAAGGGPPATIGRDRDGRLIVPAVTLHYLVPGIRRETPDGRSRLIDYLVLRFDDMVFA